MIKYFPELTEAELARLYKKKEKLAEIIRDEKVLLGGRWWLAVLYSALVSLNKRQPRSRPSITRIKDVV